MGRPSAIGYGWQPYGHSQSTSALWRSGNAPFPVNAGYGRGDWAEYVTWRMLPEHTRSEDGIGSLVPEPLRGMIDCIKPLMNELIAKWVIFPTLWDAHACPIAQLPKLAYNVGIVIDPTKSEALQRSEVFGASQLFVHKGDDLGYTIVAGFEGLLVEIIALWADDQAPGSALTADDPTAFVAQYDEVAADDIPTDQISDDRYALWPKGLYVLGSVRTMKLRLVFYPTEDQTQDFDPDVAGRIATRLLRFKPIHVEIDRITFDGLRGSSQTWVEDIDAGDLAAGMWTAAVTGAEYAASATWVAPVVADTV